MIYDERIERALLGTILLDPSQLEECDLLPHEMYLESHNAILGSLMALGEAGGEIDYLTLSDHLRRSGRLHSVGGMAYLQDLTIGVPSKSKVEPYVRIVREKYRLRQILSLCADISSRAEEGYSSQELYSMFQSPPESHETKIKSIAEVAVATLENISHQRSKESIGIRSGINSLDCETTGFRDGELTYVGAMPGRGKTSFLLQCAYAAAREGTPAGIISLEMRSEQLARRLGVLHSGLTAFKFRDPRTMNDSEWQVARRALFGVGDLPIQICDQSGLRPYQIRSIVNRMHNAGARIIFVDFVQIIHEDGKDRREAINKVSSCLRDSCKSLNIPFVVASQLARRDADPNRRPTLQDLRESGNLEQDAHNVFLLYRPKDKSTGDWTGEDEIIIDKQREGMTGIIPVRYDPKLLVYRERV